MAARGPDADGKLKELQERISDCKPDPDDPEFLKEQTLRRYLVARDYDVHAAEKQLRETLEWRHQTKPQNVVCTYCQKNPGCHAMRQVGIDRKGRPVIYCGFPQCTSQHHSTEESLQHTIFLMENAARSAQQNAHSLVWVMDFTGMKMSSCNPRQSLAVERILSHHYPECLGALVCVNHGFLFQTVWKAIKPFIDQKTVAKVYIHRHQEKIEEEFTELFPDDLRHWLLEEMRLNKEHPLSDSQKQFYKKPVKNSECHDPRGCPSYVKDYLDAFPVEDYVEGMTRIYVPHLNIVQELCPGASDKDLGSGVQSK